MRFSDFIDDHLDEIIAEWERFARTMELAAPLSGEALRDHCREILLAIAIQMEAFEPSEVQSAVLSKPGSPGDPPENPATLHGSLRYLAGFDPVQLVGEFRALRYSVMTLWQRSGKSSGGESAMDELIRFNQALDRALSDSVERYAADVAASRDMFLAVFGHDLRSPLSVVDMSAMLLVRPELSQASREQALARIGRAAREMNRLVTDLLEYTRTRLGAGIPIELKACDLRELCEQAIDSARASHPRQVFELHSSGDLQLQADVSRIRQALSNLLYNAVQHGATGPITLTAQGEPGEVVLSVANAGPPIPPEALPAIFEPLMQAGREVADRRSSRSATSLGLGLFIVRQIVSGHRGSIEVESSAESGTVFTMRLPRG